MSAELATSLTASEADRLEQAEASVRDFCGWHIAPERTETVTFGQPSGPRLMLPSLYVTAVSSVVVDGITLDAADYLAHQSGWIERVGYGTAWYGDVVTVTFTHGYVFPPANVTAAVQSLAQNAVGNPAALSRKSIGPFAEVYSLPASLLTGLGKYRIVPVG